MARTATATAVFSLTIIKNQKIINSFHKNWFFQRQAERERERERVVY
jgi:hypothetical protein